MSGDVDEVETSRCTGHCCRAFALPTTTDEELAWQPTLFRMAERGDPLPKGARLFVDGDVVAKMVIPLGVFSRNPLLPPGPPDSDPAMFYTCKNLLPNGDCNVYRTRPAVCRGFPYRDEPCTFPGCTRRCAPSEATDCGLSTIRSAP